MAPSPTPQPSAGVEDPGSNFGGVLIDLDSDGFLDLYGARYQFQGHYRSGLYLNNGDGTFRDGRAGLMTERNTENADINALGKTRTHGMAYSCRMATRTTG
ncbi:MAG: FG-GAP repeat domain-containing protein [Planctomycetota bacterium]